MSRQGGHSAQVKMRLLLNGSSIPIAQMGPDFLILESATKYPPSDAILELCVDASERRWKVRLPHGISDASRTVTIAKPFSVFSSAPNHPACGNSAVVNNQAEHASPNAEPEKVE